MPKRVKSSKSAPKTIPGKAKTAKRAGAKTATDKSVKKTAAKRPAAKFPVAGKSVTKKAQTPASKAAPLLAEGQPAPAFSLPRDGGQTVSLTSYAGRKLVIFFYPRADTPGCTLEAIAFSRLADDFAIAGTAILGVSADPVTKQDAFRDKHGLTVPLASEETLAMLKTPSGAKNLYGKVFMGIIRTTVRSIPQGSRKSGLSGSMGLTLCWRLPSRFRELTMKGSN